MILWSIVIILLLIVANGFFVAAEISIIAARKGRLEQMSRALRIRDALIAAGVEFTAGNNGPGVRLRRRP